MTDRDAAEELPIRRPQPASASGVVLLFRKDAARPAPASRPQRDFTDFDRGDCRTQLCQRFVSGGNVPWAVFLATGAVR